MFFIYISIFLTYLCVYAILISHTHLSDLMVQNADLAGGHAIQTNVVTSTPYYIRYTAQDAQGNTAAPVVRRVSVYDPCPPEHYCPDTGLQPPLLCYALLCSMQLYCIDR